MPQTPLLTRLEEQRELVDLFERAAVSGQPDRYSGKRSDTRVSQPIRLEVLLDLPDGAEVIAAHLHNISPHGLSLWTRREVPVGKTLFIRAFSPDGGRPWFQADVIYTAKGLSGLLVGAKFHEPIQI